MSVTTPSHSINNLDRVSDRASAAVFPTKSANSIRSHTMPLTAPFVSSISTGAARVSNSMPSSAASLTSSAPCGHACQRPSVNDCDAQSAPRRDCGPGNVHRGAAAADDDQTLGYAISSLRPIMCRKRRPVFSTWGWDFPGILSNFACCVPNAQCI
jgi:hypothetical protein